VRGAGAPCGFDLFSALDSLLLSMRLAVEVRAFKGFKAYAHMAQQVASVCRQNEGWIKSTEKR
jgi:hypothetical protein